MEHFLRNEALKASTLFLVGDIFDFWFEWRHAIPARAFRILNALHELKRNGVEIHYIAGNHDGHIGEILHEEVGLEIHRDPIDARIDGKKFRVIHGDGVAGRDIGYRILRALVRWKPTESIFKLVHPDFGIWFANRLSKFSRDSLSADDKFGSEPYKKYAFKKLKKEYDFVVMGHRHDAGLFKEEGGVFLQIGDWMNKGSFGVYENDEIKLKFYK